MSDAIARVLDAFYARRPVTATFTGLHAHDHALPDWSPDGLAAAVDEMRAQRRRLDEAGRVADAAVRRFPQEVDLALADGMLEIQVAEHEGPHFYRGNPALWTGEAIFGVIALVTRDFAPAAARLGNAIERLRAIPAFLHDAERTLVAAPAEWTAKARRECRVAMRLFGETLPDWVPGAGVPSATSAAFIHASRAAAAAFETLDGWLGTSLRAADDAACAAGEPLLSLLLRRGHWVDTPVDALLAEARAALDDEVAHLDTLAAPHGGWPAVQAALANQHPGVAGYLARFRDTWDACKAASERYDLVTWPDAPLRYVPVPAHMREAQPQLYYLFYRSPAPDDPAAIYDYVVTPIEPDMPADVQRERLRSTNDSVITLNHVVHHGALGHHVQNHHAYRGLSRIGRVAAVDGASRIAMFCGGSLAEGWACYACDLMDEVKFLPPLIAVAQQQTRVRLAARAVADLSLHTGRLSVDEVATLYVTSAGMAAAAARAEAIKNSMFPGAAVMYWLGTRGLHALRQAMMGRDPVGFRLRPFHDRVLSYGAIPVALIARLMAPPRGFAPWPDQQERQA